MKLKYISYHVKTISSKIDLKILYWGHHNETRLFSHLQHACQILADLNILKFLCQNGSFPYVLIPLEIDKVKVKWKFFTWPNI